MCEIEVSKVDRLVPLSEKQKKNSRDDEDHVYTNESVSLSLKTEAKKSLPVFLFQNFVPLS